MNLVIIGAPGSGKGTQSKLIEEEFGLVHLSTGDLLRKAIKGGLPLKAAQYMEAGKLVPDSLMLELIEAKISAAAEGQGFLFDGFPRTLAQAKGLDQLFIQLGKKLEVVICLEVGRAELVERLSGRRISEKTGREYHVKFFPPKVEGVCDIDSSRLIIRPDDKPERIAVRLDVFQEQTAPVISYYSTNKLLERFDASLSPAQLFGMIADLLRAKIAQVQSSGNKG